VTAFGDVRNYSLESRHRPREKAFGPALVPERLVIPELERFS
jgi:hypothetical protein